jgi:hypothetical protein
VTDSSRLRLFGYVHETASEENLKELRQARKEEEEDVER